MAGITDEVREPEEVEVTVPAPQAMEEVPIDDVVPPPRPETAPAGSSTEKKSISEEVRSTIDTVLTHMSESVETGIKRQTPQIADPENGPTKAERLSHYGNEVLSGVNEYFNRNGMPQAKVNLNLPDPEITVGSWNIRACVGTTSLLKKAMNVDRTAKVIKDSKVDICGLQEVEMHTERYPGKMHVELMEKAGLTDCAFMKTCDKNGGEHGMAVLSRYPILEKKGVMFGAMPGALFGSISPRGALAVRVQPPHLKCDVWFVTTHLPNDITGIQQEIQIAELANFVEGLTPQGSTIVTGDLNTPPMYKATRDFKARGWKDVFFHCGKSMDLGLTHPAIMPVARLDYIFVSENTDWKSNKAWVVKTKASDHRPVMATLKM